MAGGWLLCVWILLFLLRCGNCQYYQLNLTVVGVTCNMSSEFKSEFFGPSLDCHGALNGRTGTTLINTGNPATANCFLTDQNGSSQYWQVDLGQTRNIHRIIIYPELSLDSMRNTKVYLDTALVFTFPDQDESQINVPQYIPVNTRGRVIKLFQDTNQYKFVAACEVQVEDCESGRYEQDCRQTCSAGCQVACDTISGNCTCKPGWTGSQCQACYPGYYKQGDNCALCGTGCQGGTCEDGTGHCACWDGWQPQMCETCVAETYGPDCQQTCSAGCQMTCNGTNGACTCKREWTGQRCEDCTAGYYNNSGSCAPCGSGCSDTCLTQSGHCTCKPGWTPPLCQKACASGRFGQNCQQTCASGCDGACDVITGNCSCGPPWKPPDCTECSAGHYGPSSGCRACGAGCESVTSCDPVNGICTCRTGWEPPTCRACKTKLWGVNCSVTCGNCGGDGSCDLISGSCNFGLSSFEGESNTGAIVGSVLGVGVFIGVPILVVGVLLLRSRRLRRSSQPEEQTGDNCRNDAKATETALDAPNNMRTLKDTSPEELPDNGADNYDKLDRYENSDDIKPYASLQARNSDTTATGTNVYEIPENNYENNKRD